jgi:GxxExxY protein
MKRPAPLTDEEAAARVRAFCRRAWSLWCMRRAADRVYTELGWGWRESTYREALAVELQQRGFVVQQEIVAPIMYRGQPLSHTNMKMDLVVRNRTGCWLLELKVSAAAMASARQQCVRYLAHAPHHDQARKLRAAMVLVFPDKAGQAVRHALARPFIPSRN